MKKLALLLLAGSALVAPAAAQTSGTPFGTVCPAALPLGAPFTNTASAPTGTTLNIWDGTQCVQWATLNQTAHSITISSSPTGAALTRTNDTNVTLTLGGTPATALLQATSITAGWAGTLAVARGGTGGGSASGTLLDNITGFASTGFLTRTGAGTYAFQSATNGVTLGNLAQSGANTMLGNWTGSTANVAANAMPSCADSGGNHLNYVSGTGVTCGTGGGNGITALTGDVTATGPGSVAATLATVNASPGTSGSSTAIPTLTVNGKGLVTSVTTNAVIAPAGTLSGTTLASNVVTSSLTSVGTIGTGTWQGTAITVGFGGTGVATLAANGVLYGNGTSALQVTAAGSANQVLRVPTGGNPPAFGSLDLTQSATAVAAWTSWVPTLTSGGGTLGTYTINRARYVQIGKIVEYYADITITSIGTVPTGDVLITVPVNGPAVNFVGFASGREQTNTGNWIGGPVSGNVGGGNIIRLSMYGGVFAGSNGNELVFGGTYEAN